MIISFRNIFLPVICAFLFTSLTIGCGTTEDPTQKNNQPDSDPPVKYDTGEVDVWQPPVNPYEKLGFPEPLEKLPEGATAPWPGTISHGALITIEHIIDGDTIRNPLDSQKNIRLLGMDAPECAKHNTGNGFECDPNNTRYTTVPNENNPNEPYGAQAGQALKDLIAINPEVRIACKMVGGECERDRYQRFLAWIVVETPDGPVDASHYIIEQGLGWTYTSFPTENMAMYCKTENEAIAEKRGMWKDGKAAAIAAVTPETRKWYQYHDGRCKELQR